MLNFPPTLLLNADFRPLSYFPLSTMNFEQTIYQIVKARVDVVEEYDIPIRSPSRTIMLPSIVALKEYKNTQKKVAFTRFNVFLRDDFTCQYCQKKRHSSELTFDHVVPRAIGGKSTWTNVTTCCVPCNFLKGSRTDIRPIRKPYKPAPHQLQEMGRRYPPKYLHESWNDYIHWDIELDET